MTFDEAKAHLKKVIDGDGLYDASWYLYFSPINDQATLDGYFSAEDLEAIAVFMRHQSQR